METKKSKILNQRKAYLNGDINVREIASIADCNYNYVIQVFGINKQLEEVAKKNATISEEVAIEKPFSEPNTTFESEIEDVDISSLFKTDKMPEAPEVIYLSDGRKQIIYQSKMNV